MIKHPYRSSTAAAKRWHAVLRIPASTWRREYTYHIPKLWPDEFNSALASKIPVPSNDSYSLRSEISESNKTWFSKVNPKLTPDEVSFYGRQVEHLLEHGEYQFYSALALNEFLNQDSVEVYRDFLEANSERIYSLLEKLELTVYPHSKVIFDQLVMADHILHLRPGAKNELKDSVELLTKAQIKLFLQEPVNGLRTQPGTVPKVIQAKLAKQRGEVEKLPSTSQIYNAFFLAFTKTLANESLGAGYRFDKLSSLAVEYLNDLMKDVYTKTEHTKLGQISSAEALNVSKHFLAIAEELTPRELFAVIAGLGTPSLFSRGSRAIARDFLIKLTELPAGESVPIFQSLAEIIISYEDPLPTATQWLNALANDELMPGSGPMMAVMVSGGETEVAGPNSAQNSLRYQLNVRCAS